ncbi:hypothetical protein SAMN06265373_11336 [Shimia sagamensis]|uniref:Uncharacterized protein n=1 Tax=Shimia sagamensis TaxID=1566352 RepID=A0ABY1PK31_9RHOB|nr:hypothetical protein SAMN06265373_11336 [Shimia sagamensis]
MPASGRSGEGPACRNRPRKARLMPLLRPTTTRRPRWNYQRIAGRNACEIRPPSSYGGGFDWAGRRHTPERWPMGRRDNTTRTDRTPSAPHLQGALNIGLGGGDCPLALSGLLMGRVCGGRASRSRCTGPDGMGPVWGTSRPQKEAAQKGQRETNAQEGQGNLS